MCNVCIFEIGKVCHPRADDDSMARASIPTDAKLGVRCVLCRGCGRVCRWPLCRLLGLYIYLTVAIRRRRFGGWVVCALLCIGTLESPAALF